MEDRVSPGHAGRRGVTLSAAAAGVTELAQIDALIDEFFGCFDNRGGRVPSVAAMTRLFAPAAAISQHKGGVLELYSPGEFAAPRVQLLTGGTLVDFHEWELDAATRVAGPIATRVSGYAKAGCLAGAAFSGAGTKVFQLVRCAALWRILALSWFDGADALTARTLQPTPR